MFAHKLLEKKFIRLSPNLQKEGMDFIDFLLQREEKRRKRKPKLDWIGGLKDFRDKYTSLELQHKISDWRLKDELDRH